GLGVHVGVARALGRVAVAGRRGGDGAHVDPLWARTLQHGGGGRLRGGDGRREGQEAARAVAALRDGAGGHRSQVNHLGGALGRARESQKGRRSWRTAKKSSSTTRTRATWAASTRTIRTWARASWARR